ncbi:MAG: hypothetical protein R3324_01150 [Halobacteriales archaeon]|nr:hypothetical protein [Halobacteriales archaeon]
MGADAPGDNSGTTDRPSASDRLVWYERFRETLKAKTPDEFARELPGLVDQLAETTRSAPDTDRFLIGVSLSRNETLLDYTLEQVQEDGGVSTLKEPISSNHRYVTVPYPPDPHVDAAGLRGALLVSLEAQLRQADDEKTDPSIARLWDQLHGER